MNYTEFAEYIGSKLEEEYAGMVQCKPESILKNNGVHYHGISIRHEGESVAPTIYLDDLFREYEEDEEALDDICERVLTVYCETATDRPLDLEFFDDWSKVRRRVVYKLIHMERNRELLKTVPHKKFLDMAVVFQYEMELPGSPRGVITINGDYVKRWGITQEELEEAAIENTPVIRPFKKWKLQDLVSELWHRNFSEEDEAKLQTECDMYVLSNQFGRNGASVILYPDVLKDMAEVIGGDFYVLPCSVHEVILLPVKEHMDTDYILTMVREVNATQVLPEDFLSDNIYLYREGGFGLKLIS